MEPLHLASLWSRALAGANAIPIAVEVHLGNGLPQFQIVGLPDAEVRESRERVRVALQSSGYEFPQRRITVNLAPAEIPKESSRFDLPIALGTLLAAGVLPRGSTPGLEFAGELALDGGLRPIRGALAMARAAALSQRQLIMPSGSAAEVAGFAGLPVLAAATLQQVCDHLRGVRLLAPAPAADPAPAMPAADDCVELPDLADVRGQLAARRALEVAAAGGHSLLLHGPPGCGKTLLAERLVGLLPPLRAEEALELAVNRSLAAVPIASGSLHLRPLRRPHHTSPAQALTGGGSPLRPGEMSLAHAGVLLLDELPEFPRAAIEALREPLESGEIRLARVHGHAVFPARFQLACTMNSCPCGRTPDSSPPCRCTPERIHAYRARVSLPVLDRIDLWIAMHGESTGATGSVRAETSAEVADRVAAARTLQIERQGCENARLPLSQTVERARLDPVSQAAWFALCHHHQLSPRGAHRLLRVARTVADLAGDPRVGCEHLHEAAGWRVAL